MLSFSCCGLIGWTMVSSIIGFGLVSKESLRFIMSILLFSFSFLMTSWGLFFLANFLPRLRTFPITTMINVNIVCFCCSSITSFQTFSLLYNYWSVKVFQSSFSIVSHQNNNEWENLPLLLLNYKQMKVISTITMKWHWSLISYPECSSTMKDVLNAAPA